MCPRQIPGQNGNLATDEGSAERPLYFRSCVPVRHLAFGDEGTRPKLARVSLRTEFYDPIETWGGESAVFGHAVTLSPKSTLTR